MKKGVLKNFAKSAGKHLCQRQLFNKVAGLMSATLFKNRLAKFLRTSFVLNTSGRLLLWTTASEGWNTKYLELIKRRSIVQEKYMSCERALNFDQSRTFPKTISQWEFHYDLLTNLPRIVQFTDFSPGSFKLKRDILPLLTKYVS